MEYTVMLVFCIRHKKLLQIGKISLHHDFRKHNRHPPFHTQGKRPP